MPYGERPYIGYSNEQLIQKAATQEAQKGLDPLTLELAQRLDKAINEINYCENNHEED